MEFESKITVQIDWCSEDRRRRRRNLFGSFGSAEKSKYKKANIGEGEEGCASEEEFHDFIHNNEIEVYTKKTVVDLLDYKYE